MKRDKPPHIIVRKTPRGLSPVAAFFAEGLMSAPIGTEYDLVPRTKRSNPHHAKYWATLGDVVRATGQWPTAAHLHDELKLACGYMRKVPDWQTGRVLEIVDSIAFDKMTQAEFNDYFTAAMAKLTEHVGFDPLAYGVAA